MVCATCGCPITYDYYRILDNYLQVKYFDYEDGSDNVFCSEACICKALSVEHFHVDEAHREKAD